MKQTTFVPSEHGFAFANSFPDGTPVMALPTPWGRIPIGDAGAGVCGGMVFAALDLFRYGQTPPPESTTIFPYLCRRLIDSFNLPFGVLKYYQWQCRPSASRWMMKQRIQTGTYALTVEHEWPKIQAMLDVGHPAPLGLVIADSYNPWHLNRNHQVLATAYEMDHDDVRVQIYDPNYPGRDDVWLMWNLSNPDVGGDMIHSLEDRRIRGVFLTEYRLPLQPYLDL